MPWTYSQNRNTLIYRKPNSSKTKVFSLLFDLYSAVHVVFHSALSTSHISLRGFSAFLKLKPKFKGYQLFGCAGAVSAQVQHISFCSKLDRPPVLMKDWTVAVVGRGFAKGQSCKHLFSRVPRRRIKSVLKLPLPHWVTELCSLSLDVFNRPR